MCSDAHKGPGVGQVRADIHPDKDGEHGTCPGGGGQRQQHQHGGQVVDHVGQHGGQRRHGEQGRQRRAAGDQVLQSAAEPVAGDRAHHDAQGQHEGEEGHVRGTGDRGRGGCGAGPGRGRRAASAPAQAAKAGLMPAVEATTKPASVHATVTSANSGVRGGSAVVGAALRRPGRWRRSGARRRYSTAMAASQSTAVRAAKRVKLTPLAANASRLVRLETGNSREDRSNSPVDAGPRQSLTAGARPGPGGPGAQVARRVRSRGCSPRRGRRPSAAGTGTRRPPRRSARPGQCPPGVPAAAHPPRPGLRGGPAAGAGTGTSVHSRCRQVAAARGLARLDEVAGSAR